MLVSTMVLWFINVFYSATSTDCCLKDGWPAPSGRQTLATYLTRDTLLLGGFFITFFGVFTCVAFMYRQSATWKPPTKNHAVNRRPVKSPLEKVRSDFFFSKNQFLWVLTLSHKKIGSSLDHLAAVFTAKKTQNYVIGSLRPKPDKRKNG